MNKALVLLLLAVLYANPSVAQTETFKREVGFSTQFLFENIFKSGEAPVELMYKTQLTSGNWLRLGIRTQVNFRESAYDDAHNFRVNEGKSFYIQPSLGLEKRMALSEKWIVPMGIDVLVHYSQAHSRQEDPMPNIYSSESSHRGYGATLRPFLGITYSPIPRLYLSTEASASLSYSVARHWSEQVTADNIQSSMNENITNVNLSLRPAASIFVYYKF